MRKLDVRLYGVKAGVLSQDDSGRLAFVYDSDYLQQQAPPLSVSLPLQEAAFSDRATKPFFSGLLPDEVVRQRLAAVLGVSAKNPFSLLEAVGGECAGAVVLCPPGEPLPSEDETDYEVLDGSRLGQLLTELKSRPLLAGERGVRLSLAGAQDKLAVRVVDGQIRLMKGGGATTHIVKPAISDVEDSVANEFFCLTLAQRMGIVVPQVEMHRAGGIDYLLVVRYDREQRQGRVVRLHQEDFCQALSIPPEMKYESEGGPGMDRCMEVLQRYSSRPAADRRHFFRRVLFSVLVGNMDAHGKNYSLVYPYPERTGGMAKPVLAPLYDVLSTVIYPGLSDRLAMKIAKKKRAEDLYLRHWQSLVPDTALAKKNLRKDLLNFSRRILQQSEELVGELERGEWRSPVFVRIGEAIVKRAGRVQQF